MKYRIYSKVYQREITTIKGKSFLEYIYDVFLMGDIMQFNGLFYNVEYKIFFRIVDCDAAHPTFIQALFLAWNIKVISSTKL